MAKPKYRLRQVSWGYELLISTGYPEPHAWTPLRWGDRARVRSIVVDMIGQARDREASERASAEALETMLAELDGGARDERTQGDES